MPVKTRIERGPMERILDRHDFKNVGHTHSIDPGSNEIVVRCQGDPSASSVMTVVLIRRDKIPITGGPGALLGWPYAQIEFGNGGTLATVECDIINGLAFSLPGRHIQVKVFNPSDSPGPMDLGAFLSYFPIARNARLKRSFPVGVIAAAAQSALIAVPPFAGTVTFERTNNGSFQVDFYDNNQNLRYSVPVNNGENLPPVEISAGVSAIRILNTNFAQLDRGSVIFGLEV